MMRKRQGTRQLDGSGHESLLLLLMMMMMLTTTPEADASVVMQVRSEHPPDRWRCEAGGADGMRMRRPLR